MKENRLGICTAAPRVSSMAVNEENLIRVYGVYGVGMKACSGVWNLITCHQKLAGSTLSLENTLLIQHGN